MGVGENGELFSSQRSQDFFNLRLYPGHPSVIAADAHDSRLEAQRDEFPLVEILLTIHVAPNLNRKFSFGL